jgi:hypothetical protein
VHGLVGITNVRFGSKADMTLRSDECPLTSQSDIRGYGSNVCFVPIADIRPAENYLRNNSRTRQNDLKLGKLTGLRFDLD